MPCYLTQLLASLCSIGGLESEFSFSWTNYLTRLSNCIDRGNRHVPLYLAGSYRVGLISLHKNNIYIYYKTNTRIDLFSNKTINNKATKHMKIYVRRDLLKLPHVIGISSTPHNLHRQYYLMTIGNYK